MTNQPNNTNKIAHFLCPLHQYCSRCLHSDSQNSSKITRYWPYSNTVRTLNVKLPTFILSPLVALTLHFCQLTFRLIQYLHRANIKLFPLLVACELTILLHSSGKQQLLHRINPFTASVYYLDTTLFRQLHKFYAIVRTWKLSRNVI